MRIILVGPAADRARLRVQLDGAGLDIVGEFSTAAVARRSGVEADALLVAAEEPSRVEASEDAVPEPLTPREIQVLGLMAEGLPNKAIAGRLGISAQTVKCHVAAISGKLGAANRTDAVRRAVRRGLVTL